MADLVIIGGGHAAGQACASLRAGGWSGSITLVGEEPYPPYQRPPLSKAYLLGTLPAERLLFRPESFYTDHDVTLRLGERALRIDRAARRVETDRGSLGYDALLLATGARPRPLTCAGADLGGVFGLRSIADVDAIKQRFDSARHLVIIGAGYIGLEVAAVAKRRGLNVTVLEAQDRVMSRVTSPLVSDFFTMIHREEGVDLRLGAQVGGVEGREAVEAVRLADGTRVPADLVVYGIGVLPNQEIAAEAGLATENGILVDENARTEDPAIYAVGDCTNHPNPLLDRRLRLESVHNALEQAKTAAAALCGSPKPYAQIPWFWSDQYELKLQTVGLQDGYDATVVRGAPEARSFAVFYLRGEALIAVDAVNEPAAFMAAKKLVGRRVERHLLEDPGTSLRDLAMAAQRG